MMETTVEQNKPNTFEEKNTQHRALFKNLVSLKTFDSFQKIAELTEQISLNHGFGLKFKREVELLGLEDAIDNMVSRGLALQHSEVSETLEEARPFERDFKLFLEEQSDVLIRTINMMYTVLQIAKDKGQIDSNAQIGDFIHPKIAKNIERPYAHGNKRF